MCIGSTVQPTLDNERERDDPAPTDLSLNLNLNPIGFVDNNGIFHNKHVEIY